MYYNISAGTQYQDYEAFIARTVRDRKLASLAHLGAHLPLRPRYMSPQSGLSGWLHTWRRQLEQHLQPPEEGYIA